MNDMESRNKFLAAVATDAANAGAVKIAKESLQKINDFSAPQTRPALDAVRFAG